MERSKDSKVSHDSQLFQEKRERVGAGVGATKIQQIDVKLHYTCINYVCRSLLF